MGKRSEGTFERNPRDFYPTPKEAVLPLVPHIPKNSTYVEPCCGDGALTLHLDEIGLDCIMMSDIEPQGQGIKLDAFDIKKQDIEDFDDYAVARYIITNPPWSRDILHPMIDHFRQLLPTWLLFDSDWMHTVQAKPYLPFCEKIVSVGRVKWIPDSKHTGKDNCCWYLFRDSKHETKFYGR